MLKQSNYVQGADAGGSPVSACVNTGGSSLGLTPEHADIIGLYSGVSLCSDEEGESVALMNTTNNPKFKRLYRRLGLGIAQTLGHLECLWQYTHSTANPVYKPADVEPAAEWEGEPGVLLAALVAEGWLDEHKTGLVEVHDYWENCPQTVRDRIKKREQRAGHVRDASPEKAENTGTCPGHVRDAADKNRIEKKRKEVEQKQDPPLSPKEEPAGTEQSASKSKAKRVHKEPVAHPEFDACCAELPALWNAAADVAGLDRSPDPITKSLRRQVQLLMAESELFCQHWRELPKAFAACRWSTSRHLGISVALRTRWGSKPGVPFEDKYMAMLSAQQRGESTNAGGWTRDSDREF